MAIATLYITGTPGLTEVSDPMLAYSTVLHLLREGKGLVETSITPTGKRFKHHPAAAKIELPADLPIQSYYAGTGVGLAELKPEEFIIMLKY